MMKFCDASFTLFLGTVQGAVMLKNVNNTLPFTEMGSDFHVGVIGPNSNLSQSISIYYGPKHPCKGFFNMVDAVAQYSKVYLF